MGSVTDPRVGLFLQSAEENTCNVTIQGLDAEKCYLFRARVKTEEPSYGPDTYPSDWSVVARWQRGELRGKACCIAAPHSQRAAAPAPSGKGAWGPLETQWPISLSRDQFASNSLSRFSLSWQPSPWGSFSFLFLLAQQQ